jgi:hypothetical protein
LYNLLASGRIFARRKGKTVVGMTGFCRILPFNKIRISDRYILADAIAVDVMAFETIVAKM